MDTPFKVSLAEQGFVHPSYNYYNYRETSETSRNLLFAYFRHLETPRGPLGQTLDI